MQRGIKKLAMVWICPPASQRRARNGERTSHFFGVRRAGEVPLGGEDCSPWDFEICELPTN